MTSATCVLALGPNGISGGTWRDESGSGNHATITGASATSTSTAGGTLNGLAFDGVNDRLDGSVSIASDGAVTVFVLALQDHTSNASGLHPILELSDNGSGGRSIQIGDGNGYRYAFRQTTDAQAYYAFTSDSLRLHRFTFGANYIESRENGLVKASNILAPSSRAPTSYRIGGGIAGTTWWKGSLFALRVYSGALSERDAELVELDMLRAASLAEPYVFPDARSVLHTDPVFLLPAVLRMNVGQVLSIYLDAVQLSTDGYRELTVTAGAGLTVDRTYPDRLLITTSGAGDFSLTLAADGYSASTTIRATAALSGATTKRVLFLGDSNTDIAKAGWIEHFGAALNASATQVTMIGAVAPVSPYSYRHDGWGGATFASWLADDEIQGRTSPFRVAGVTDMAAYSEAYGAPDVVFIMLGSNDWYGATDGTRDAILVTTLANAETLLGVMQGAWPGASFVFQLPNPGWRIPESGGTEAGRISYRKNQHYAAKALLDHFGGREAERIFVSAACFQFDTVEGYGDLFHANPSPGHRQLALPLIAEYTAAQAASAVVRVVSANIDGVVGASKITIVWSEACTANVTGLTLTGVATNPTVSSVASGSGTTTHVYNLSASATGIDTPILHIGSTRLVESSSGARKAAVGKASVSVTNLSNPLLTAPGTPVAIFGGDQLTFSSGVNIETIVDEGPAGNTVTFLGGTRATQVTTAGGHKHIRCAASPNHGWYQRNALTSDIPANFSGTIYFAGSVANWNPAGGYGALFNTTNTTTEGGGYTSGMFVTPTSGSRWKLGYGADSTLLTVIVAPSDMHVWAWTIEHDVAVKLYKDGVLIDSGTPTPDPVLTNVLRLFTLMFSSHTPFEGDVAKLAIYAGSSSANAHDAFTVATISTYLASLTT